MSNNRPMTQRELKQVKTSKTSEPKATVENLTRRTLVIQLRDQNSDFYVGERAIHISSGKTLTERVSLFNASQISNLRARGEIRVIGNI